MMRTNVAAVCIAAAVSVCFCSRPPAVQWTRSFGPRSDTTVYCVQQTKDKGFIAEGRVMVNADTGWGVVLSMYILKMDSLGNTEWQRCDAIGDIGGIPHAVQQTSDGGYVLAGMRRDSGVFVRKTDSLWNRQWGFSDFEYADASDIRQTRDRGFITGGAWRGLYLLKLDSLGEVEWRRTYHPNIEVDTSSLRSTGDLNWPLPTPIRQTRDKGYLIATKVLQKVDSTGNLVWMRDYDRTMYVINSVEQTNDGGYIATGVGPLGGVLGNFTRVQARRRVYARFGAGDILLNNWVVLRMDSLGTPKWKKVFAPALTSFRLSWLEHGVESYGTCVIQTRDGGYAVGGSVTTRQTMGWLVKTDPHGNPIWTMTFGGWESVSYCMQSEDGGYIIGDGYKHIMKLAPDGK